MGTLRQRLRGPFAAFIAAAVLSAPGGAGVPLQADRGSPVRWSPGIEQPNVKSGAVTWYADPNGSVEEPAGDVFESDAVALAAQEWTRIGTGRIGLVQDTGRKAYGPSTTDRVNLLSFRSFELGPFTLAITRIQESNGVVSDADIIFNDTTEFVRWSTTEKGLHGHADVRAVAAHELGHLLGLDHSPVAAATMSAVQRLGSIHGRTLHGDDVGALTAAYAGPAETTLGSITGTVRVRRRKARRGVSVFALDAATGSPLGSTFTDDDGIYRIRSLPPGPYLVAAFPIGNPARHSPWWASADPRLTGGVHGVDDGPGTGAPRFVEVRAGYPEVNRDIVVTRTPKKGFAEPDDDPAQARRLPLRGWAAGAFEVPLDEDWFEVPLEGANAITVRVRAAGIGSIADAEVAIFAADGTTPLGSLADNRSPLYDEWSLGPEGTDLDADLVSLVPPGGDHIFVRVRAQPASEVGGPAAYYLLTVFPAEGVPDGRLSVLEAAPPSLRAGTATSSRITARPRDFAGSPVPGEATVTLLRDDGGPDLPMVAVGDGTWIADLPAPALPGTVRLGLEVALDSGTGRYPWLATLEVAGVADTHRSTIAAAPRRVEADGKAVSRVRVTPRDGDGRLLGDDMEVVFVPLDAAGADLGPVRSLGLGTYEVDVVAPSVPGSLSLGVALDGVATGIATRVGFGYVLSRVALDLGAEVAETAGVPGLSRSTGRRMGRAGQELDALAAAQESGEERAIAAAAARSVRALHRAGGTGPWLGGDDAAGELAESLRRRVHDLLDPFHFPVPDPAGEKALGRARALLARAEAAFQSGDPVKGADLLARSMAAAGRLF